MRTRPVGSIIGAVAGLVFVLVNAGEVPSPLIWRLAAAVAFVAIIWFVVLRGPEVVQAPPSPGAVWTYGFSVTGMVVAIPAGAAIISNVLDRPDAVLTWVVFVVGVHFVPFARAFQLPMFRWLSASLVLVAVVGAATTLAFDSPTAPGWTGVVAGFVLLFFSAIGPRASSSRPASAASDPGGQELRDAQGDRDVRAGYWRTRRPHRCGWSS